MGSIRARHGGRIWPVRRWLVALPVLACIACAPEDFPEDPMLIDETLEPPRLAPLEPILQSMDVAADADDPDPELRQRGEDLRRRADAVPSGPEAAPVRPAPAPPVQEADPEAEARAAELRARADALRNAEDR